MFSDNGKLSNRQLQALLILDLFGIGVITLPSLAAALGGQNGWLLILGAALFIAFYSFILYGLAKRFPGDTFIEYSQKLVTKPVGILLSIGLLIKILLSTGLSLRVFGEILKETILFRTPMTLTIAVMLLLCAFTAWQGYECRGRLAEILVLVLIIPLLFLFSVAAVNSDFTNLLPAFTLSGGAFLKGSLWIALSLQGLEFLLLVIPFVRKPQRAGKAIFISLLVIGALMVLVTAITLARFGEKDIQRKLWPVLQMMDTMDLPGSFIERQDAIMMKFWIISIFAGTNAGIFLGSLGAERLVSRKIKQNHWILIFVLALFFTALWPRDISQTYWLLYCVNGYGNALYFFILPILLMGVSLCRKGGKEH